MGFIGFVGMTAVMIGWFGFGLKAYLKHKGGEKK